MTTTITAPAGLPYIVLERDFAAPRHLVYRAHTEEDLLVRWLGPAEMTMKVEHFDCRTGGSYRYIHSHDGGDHVFFGAIHEVTPDEGVVQTFGYEGVPGTASLERLTLSDTADGGTRLRVHSTFESVEARDGMVASGMERGVQDSHDRLTALLPELFGEEG